MFSMMIAYVTGPTWLRIKEFASSQICSTVASQGNIKVLVTAFFDPHFGVLKKKYHPRMHDN